MPTDSNTLAERNHQADLDKNMSRWQKALAQAWDDFDCGGLDDQIREYVADNPDPATRMCLHNIYPFRREESDEAFMEFKRMVQHVILKHAEREYESIHL